MAFFAALAAFCGLMVAALLYIYFGPRSWIIAFVVGAGVIGGLYWWLVTNPSLIAAAAQNYRARAGATFLASVFENPHDLQRARIVISMATRRIMTLLFALPALYLVIDAIRKSTALFGQHPEDMTATGLYAGALAGMAAVTWFVLESREI